MKLDWKYFMDSIDEAIEMLEHALKIIGKNTVEAQLLVAIHSHLAQVFQEIDKFNKAEQHYKKCINYLENIEETPGDILADYMIKLGVMLARQEKYDECLKVTERGLALTSDDNFSLLSSIHSNLAFLYQEKGELGKAEENYKEQIAIMEKHGEDVSLHDLADAYDDLGVCIFLLNRYNEAVEALEHALGFVDGNNEETKLIAIIHNHLSQAYRADNNIEKANYHNDIYENLKNSLE